MKLMILDGNSIINRAFYGIRMLNAPDGTPTNAVYGFITILQKLVEEERPDSLCVAFDLKAPTFRHAQFEGYKAQRKGMPEDLAVQMPIAKDVLDAMNIPRLEREGYEADDLIGTVCRMCENDGWDCLIVTGDKDSFQLISERTHIRHIKTRMGKTETIEYDNARFTEEYGMPPARMIDLKALMGDSSDNIPGVAGVGEKTAITLLHRFGTLDGVYENLDSSDISASLRAKLEAGRDSAYTSYMLATIETAAPIEFSPADAALTDPNSAALYELFSRLGFAKFINQWKLSAAGIEPPAQAIEMEYSTAGVTTPDELEGALRECGGRVSVFCGGDLENIAFTGGGTVWTLRRGDYAGGYSDALKKLFAPEIEKAGHEIKDLQRRLIAEGIPPEGWVFDTSLAAYLLDATASSYELERLCPKYCGFELDSQGGGVQRSAAIAALSGILGQKLSELGMAELFEKIELPLCAVLAEMEAAGFLVDKNALCEYGEQLAAAIETLQHSIWSHAGEEFNINSTRQLGSILFDKLMLPSGKKTKTGWSTNADVLEKLRGKHPAIQDILDYRFLAKLKSTYADGLLKVISSDGRIHTSFQMTVTATGRLSSTEPNLQNIPIRRELGGEIRKMFVAAPGCVLVDADYSQIELRLLAHISGDETMRDAFSAGEDIHAVTASQVFGIPLGEVTPLMRSRAKAVNFGIVYGISDFSLAQDIGVSRKEAKVYIDAYFEKYHGVRDYMKKVVEQAKADGYVVTEFGRRRLLPELKSSNFNERSFGERVALNMPIQGTAADVIKIAMVNVRRRLRGEGLSARQILQVHDELIVECPQAEAERVAALLTGEMQAAAQFSVPLVAEAKIGRSWHDAH